MVNEPVPILTTFMAPNVPLCRDDAIEGDAGVIGAHAERAGGGGLIGDEQPRRRFPWR